LAQEWTRPPRTSSVLAYGRNGWWTTVMAYRVGESMLTRDRQRDGQGKYNAPDILTKCAYYICCFNESIYYKIDMYM